MTKTKIKVDKSYAEEKLKSQIGKSMEFLEKGKEITLHPAPSDNLRTRNRDNFKMFYNQWRDFTEAILRELFVSSNYASEFGETQSSKKDLRGD